MFLLFGSGDKSYTDGPDPDQEMRQGEGDTTEMVNMIEPERSQPEMAVMEGHEHNQPEMVSEDGHQFMMETQQTHRYPNMPWVIVCLRKKVHYLPVFTCAFIFLSFIISYSVAVAGNHVEPDFPYISHTAIEAPERGIFAQMVNIGAFLLAVNVFIRYKQMDVFLSFLDVPRRDIWINTISLVIGFASAFGLSMVANFQTIDMRAAHYTGASMAFFLGMVYCWMQTSLSIRYTRWTAVSIGQLVNSIILSVCLVIFTVSKSLYKVAEHRGQGTKFDTLRPVYLVSTVSEWLTATSTVTFLITFVRDFSNISFKSPSIKIKNVDEALKHYHTSSSSSSSASRYNGSTLV